MTNGYNEPMHDHEGELRRAIVIAYIEMADQCTKLEEKIMAGIDDEVSLRQFFKSFSSFYRLTRNTFNESEKTQYKDQLEKIKNWLTSVRTLNSNATSETGLALADEYLDTISTTKKIFAKI